MNYFARMGVSELEQLIKRVPVGDGRAYVVVVEFSDLESALGFRSIIDPKRSFVAEVKLPCKA